LLRHNVVLRTELAGTDGHGRSASIAAGAFEPDHERRRGHERGNGTQKGADGILDARRARQCARRGSGHRLGLDPAVAERIFQPFFTTKPDSLGMGLAICRSIVEARGGRLSLSPRAPHGADVRFTVPLWTDQ
jgi:Histidine kinase-, DNA gyrase B-, and HSP90-like ATPase